MADLKLSEVDQLQTKEYWDNRYQKDDDATTFDWFKTFADLEAFFRKHILWDQCANLKVVMLGCGNSTLSKDLYDAGLRHIANVDFSETCIEQMATLHRNETEMTWDVMDVRDMSAFKDGIFDVAIDKGTLDALLSYTGSVWDIPDSIKSSAWKYMDETNRILRPNGRMLYISYRQPHFARPIVERPYWTVQVETLSDPGGSFDYFGYVLQK
ncbi:S-adenosyl-L-methionine-dependent methyltransferase [Lipomyces orientalis]|uniref:S-adenosyl-L-methionine-dependent methyltransferase n=1 Tax=Lipomyces orientalis TaxID=1233043 RepID=A0ACC3TYV3_9ASCO